MIAMEEDMEISDNDEDTNVFSNAHFEDSSELLRDSRHDSPCCGRRNPYTSLSWTNNSCTNCYQSELKDSYSPKITERSSLSREANTEEMSFPIDRFRRTTAKSPSSHEAKVPVIPMPFSVDRLRNQINKSPDISAYGESSPNRSISPSSHEANITSPAIRMPFSVDRLRQVQRSPKISPSGESTPTGSISTFNFTKKYIPKSLVSSSRFNEIKLDCTFLGTTDEGLLAQWPCPFHEVDRYWDVNCNAAETDKKHSTFYKNLIKKRIKIHPQPPLVGIVDDFITDANTEEKESDREMIPYYDKYKDRRCPRFINNKPCSTFCRYSHVFPRDDGVYCKYYYLYRECPSRDCKYIHGRRCSQQTKTLYEDKYFKNRCLNYLHNKSCSDLSCEKIHRLPNSDGVLCFDQLSLECTRGSKCDYKHIDDLNTFLRNESKISNDNDDKENFVPALKDDNDSDMDGPEYYIPSTDSESEYPPYAGVGDTISNLRLKHLSLTSSEPTSSNNNIKSENVEKNISAISSSSVPISSPKNVSRTNSEKPFTLRINNRETERPNDPISKLPVNESNASKIKQERSWFDLGGTDGFELTPESDKESRKEKNATNHLNNSSSNNSSSVVLLVDLPDNHEKSNTKNNNNIKCQSLIEEEKDPPEIECLFIKKEPPVYDLSSDDEEPFKESKITTHENINLNIKIEDKNYDSDSSTKTQPFTDKVQSPNVLEEKAANAPIRDIPSNLPEEYSKINDANIKVEHDSSYIGGSKEVTDINSDSLKNIEKETTSISVKVKTEKEPVGSEVTNFNNSSVKSEPKETCVSEEGGTVEVKTEKELDGSEVSNYNNRSISIPLKRKIIKKSINNSDGKLNLPSDLKNQDSQKLSSISLLNCKREEQGEKSVVDGRLNITEDSILKGKDLSTSHQHSDISVSVNSDLRNSLCNTSSRTESSYSIKVKSLESLSYSKESLPTIKDNTQISSNSKCTGSMEPLPCKKNSNIETSTIVDKNAREPASSNKKHELCSGSKVSVIGDFQTNLNSASSPQAEYSNSKKYEGLKSLSLNKESLPTKKTSSKIFTNNFSKKSDVGTSTHISHSSKHITKNSKETCDTVLSQLEGTKVSKKNPIFNKSSREKISKIIHNLPSNVKLKRCSIYLKDIMTKKKYIKKYNLHKLFKETRQNGSIYRKSSSKDEHRKSSKNSEVLDKEKQDSSSKRTEIVSQNEHQKSRKNSEVLDKEKQDSSSKRTEIDSQNDHQKSRKNSEVLDKEKHDSSSKRTEIVSQNEHQKSSKNSEVLDKEKRDSSSKRTEIVSQNEHHHIGKSSKLSNKDKHKTSKFSSSIKHRRSSELSEKGYQSDISNSPKDSSRDKCHNDSKTPKLSNKEKHSSSRDGLTLPNKERHSVIMSPKITNQDQIHKKKPKSSKETKDNFNSKDTKSVVSVSSSYRSIEDVLCKNKENSSSSTSSIISDSSLSISNNTKISNSTHKERNKDINNRKLSTEYDKQKNKSFESHVKDSSLKSVTKDSSRLKDINNTKQKHKDRSDNEKVSSVKKHLHKDSSKASVSDDKNSSNAIISKDKLDTENSSSPISKSRLPGSSSNSSGDNSFVSKHKEQSERKSLTKDKLKSNEVKLNSHHGDERNQGKRRYKETNSFESSAKKIKENLPKNSHTSISVDKKSSSNSHVYKLPKKKSRLIITSSDDSEDSDDSREISDSRNISKVKDSSENLSSSDQSIASEREKFSEKHSSSLRTVDTASQNLKSKNELCSSKAESSSQVTREEPLSRVPLMKSPTRLQRPCPLSKKRKKESEPLMLAKTVDTKTRESLSTESTLNEKRQKLSKGIYNNDNSTFLSNNDDLSETIRTNILKHARDLLVAFDGKEIRDEDIPKAIISMCKESKLENVKEDESILSLDRNIKQYMVYLSIQYEKLPPSYYYDAPYHLPAEKLAKVLSAEVAKLKEPG